MIIRMIFRRWKRSSWYPLVTVLLVALSAAVVWVTQTLEQEIDRSWSSRTSGIDLVVGAKGSPLQLVLANVFHADAPVGNISWSESQQALSKMPVDQQIPLAYGDTYEGYRILGTTPEFQEFYELELQSGRWSNSSYELVLGSEIQKVKGVDVGDTFLGTHGSVQGGHHHEHPYKIVGVLKPSNSPADRLLLCDLETVWHEHHQSGDQREITAYLLTVKQAMAKLTLPRRINENTPFQAAVPAIEINKLLTLFGDVLGLFSAIGWLIGFIAVVVVLLVLLQSAKDRKGDLIALRMHGAPHVFSLQLLLVEGLLLVLIGLGVGALLALLLMQFISAYHPMLAGLSYLHWNGYFIVSIISAALLAALITWYQTKRWNLSHELKQTWG